MTELVEHSSVPNPPLQHHEGLGRFAMAGTGNAAGFAIGVVNGEGGGETLLLRQVFAPIPLDRSDERIANYLASHSDGAHEVRRMFNHPEPFTTPQTIQAAEGRVAGLQKSDATFKSLVERHCGKGITPEGIVAKIRYDGPLRLAIGVFMVSKVDEYIAEHPERIPSRVWNNDEKNPGKSPLKILLPESLAGRTYSALLAVSMLDGSWNDAKVGVADRMEFDANGVATSGQHEAMARLVLGTGGYTQSWDGQ